MGEKFSSTKMCLSIEMGGLVSHVNETNRNINEKEIKKNKIKCKTKMNINYAIK